MIVRCENCLEVIPIIDGKCAIGEYTYLADDNDSELICSSCGWDKFIVYTEAGRGGFKKDGTLVWK